MSLKNGLFISLFFATSVFAVSETVYVESPTDTDGDGKNDRIFVQIDRPSTDKKLSSIYYISPYALGGNDGPMHEVDMDLLPQDEAYLKSRSQKSTLRKTDHPKSFMIEAPQYATVRAHSLGTGNSTGCATVGDMNETLAAKAVIDWLNGRAKAFGSDGKEVKASWASGNVGMTGTSYDGTLPIMVATTGVEGLKAIIPVAAISNWYDYYRSNGLVVNPGGYIGEDADVLGFYIMRRGACKKELDVITQTMGRENGDFTPFWQDRDYTSQIKNIKAAVFIIHGQSDWNVKQKHAIQLWEGLEGVSARRMFLHKGGHGSTPWHGVPGKVRAWFDHFVEGVDNGITDGPQVEVELPNGQLMVQNEWPHESTHVEKLFFSSNSTLSTSVSSKAKLKMIDAGKSKRLEDLASNPSEKNEGRLVFLSSALENKTTLSGTSQVSLNFSVMNRKAANVTVAVVEYTKSGLAKIITRGWADAQNFRDISQGEKLVRGKAYQMSFNLEPKQYVLEAGSKIGILIASTDYEYTLRPAEGTEIHVNLGDKSFIELNID